MLQFKCKSCGFVISEQKVVALTKQVLGGGELFGSFKYETCLKCGSRNIESTEDTFRSYAEERPWVKSRNIEASISKSDMPFSKENLINTYKRLSSEKLLQLKKEGGLTLLASIILDEEMRRRNLDSQFIEETYQDINKMNTDSEKSKLFLKRVLGVFLIFLGILSFCLFLLVRRDDSLASFGFLCISLFLAYIGILPWKKKVPRSSDYKISEKQPQTTSEKTASNTATKGIPASTIAATTPTMSDEGTESSSIICAKCGKEFEWDQAYRQQDTPGSYEYNPPGHGDFRPRAFCPHCGFMVAEWDIDRNQDYNRWKWFGENAKVNAGKKIPPSPLLAWGKSIPPDVRAAIKAEKISIDEMKKGASKEKFIIAADGGDIETVKSQIEAGVDINTKNYRGETALILAADKGHVEVVRTLIKTGADINDQNVYGKHTALIRAALSGHIELVRVLLEAGADPTLRNQFGKTAEDAANDAGHKEIVNVLREDIEASSNKQEGSINKELLSNKAASQMTDQEMLSILEKLCNAYTQNDPVYKELEPIATKIGRQLDERGGIKEMRRIFDLLGRIPGARTLEMHWGGIGDWHG